MQWTSLSLRNLLLLLCRLAIYSRELLSKRLTLTASACMAMLLHIYRNSRSRLKITKIVYGFDLLLPTVQRRQSYSKALRFMDSQNGTVCHVFCMTYHHVITQHIQAEVKNGWWAMTSTIQRCSNVGLGLLVILWFWRHLQMSRLTYLIISSYKLKHKLALYHIWKERW